MTAAVWGGLGGGDLLKASIPCVQMSSGFMDTFPLQLLLFFSRPTSRPGAALCVALQPTHFQSEEMQVLPLTSWHTAAPKQFEARLTPPVLTGPLAILQTATCDAHFL